MNIHEREIFRRASMTPEEALVDLFREEAGLPINIKNSDHNAFVALIHDMTVTFLKKNTDYGASWKKGRAGTPAWIGVYYRMCDKVERLEHLIDNNAGGLVEESIEDTLKDLSVYALLLVLARREEYPRPDDAGAP